MVDRLNGSGGVRAEVPEQRVSHHTETDNYCMIGLVIELPDDLSRCDGGRHHILAVIAIHTPGSFFQDCFTDIPNLGNLEGTELFYFILFYTPQVNEMTMHALRYLISKHTRSVLRAFQTRCTHACGACGAFF